MSWWKESPIYEIYVRSFCDSNGDGIGDLKEMFKIMQFWLDLGVDGFRLDATNHIIHDDQFRDNEIFKTEEKSKDIQLIDGNLSNLEYNDKDEDSEEEENKSKCIIYDKDREEMFDIVVKIKDFLDVYSSKNKRQILLLTEAYVDFVTWKKFFTEARVDLPFNFSLMKLKSNNIQSAHICYYGQELGLADVPVTFQQCQDPFGKQYGPKLYSKYSRDPCRSPMPWTNGKNGGFSPNNANVVPWLPLAENFRDICQSAQMQNPKSHLHFFRELINFTLNMHSELIKFSNFHMAGIDAEIDENKIIVFERGERTTNLQIVVLNFESKSAKLSIDVNDEFGDTNHISGELVFHTYNNCRYKKEELTTHVQDGYREEKVEAMAKNSWRWPFLVKKNP
uniref:Glycosyl hydrolase family 13 catalytic domain-containing protein n=1 Tax=Romanomermis culicivorax TaxID=13658 RepID=A0A915J2F4_ROMCU